MKELTINKLPIPTWNWLKVNEVTIPWGEEEEVYSVQTQEGIQRISPTTPGYHQGKSLFSGSQQGALYLQLFSGKEEANLRWETELVVEAGENVTLVQVFLGEKKETLVQQLTARCQEGASFQLIQFVLGQGEVYSDCQVHLAEKASEYHMEVGYRTRAQTLDMNVLVAQSAEDTHSEILVEGVIGDQGVKRFRGTIDLQKGASGATGSEQENVLLLGEDLQNITVPVLLCGQEDVKGNHGTAIGELEEETLFYLNSRGIPRDMAEALIIQGKMQSILDKIPCGVIRDTVELNLQEVFQYDGATNLS